MCVCFVIYRQTVSLCHNSSAWIDTQDTSSWDRNPLNFTLDLITYRSPIYMTDASSGILTPFVLALFF